MTAELLLSMGFNQRNDIPHPKLRFFEIKKNEIKITVQMFPDNRWSAFIVITDQLDERKSYTASRHLSGITEAFQLGNFLSYL